jgi:predicted  nucleic acid-binding Zn-ribbon protein
MITESSSTGSAGPNRDAEMHQTGEQVTLAQPGSLKCTRCGYAIALAASDELPRCPNCGGESFRRMSIFAKPNLKTNSVETAETPPEWLAEARAQLEQPGSYLAFEDDDGGYAVIRLESGWTRIGRSGAADVLLDNPTVSRRHALVVVTEAGVRALDDRSLNGLFVNGERVEWAPLTDGDELEIGRYRIYLLEA